MGFGNVTCSKRQRLQNNLEEKLIAMECEGGNVEVQWEI
jgi:hypothetical protein